MRAGRGLRTALVWTLAAVAVLLVWPRPAGDAGPGSRGPGGTVALRRFLDAAGYEVSDGADLEGVDTLVLLHDRRTGREVDPILRWVRGGGRLLLGDPGSVLAARLGARPARSLGGLSASVRLEPSCAAPPAATVPAIEVDSLDLALVPTHPDAVPCFVGEHGAYALLRRYGAGTATVLGGFSPLTNARLPRAGNAAFVLEAVGPGPTVRFGPPVAAARPTGEEGGLWRLLPPPARAVLVQLAVALALFAFVRGRRLGPPVLETPLAPLPASELVRATAALYRKARATAYCGTLLREHAAAALSRRLGVRGGGDRAEVASSAARSAGFPEERVREALAGPDPGDDTELIELGRELEEVRAAVEERSR